MSDWAPGSLLEVLKGARPVPGKAGEALKPGPGGGDSSFPGGPKELPCFPRAFPRIPFFAHFRASLLKNTQQIKRQLSAEWLCYIFAFNSFIGGWFHYYSYFLWSHSFPAMIYAVSNPKEIQRVSTRQAYKGPF